MSALLLEAVVQFSGYRQACDFRLQPEAVIAQSKYWIRADDGWRWPIAVRSPRLAACDAPSFASPARGKRGRLLASRREATYAGTIRRVIWDMATDSHSDNALMHEVTLLSPSCHWREPVG